MAVAERNESYRTAASPDFLLRPVEAVPYKISSVLTDTPGASGSAEQLVKEAKANSERFRALVFEYVGARGSIIE